MNLFAQEIDELNRYSQVLPDYLKNEVQKIIDSDDKVVILLYSRRTLEILVRQICEKENIKISETIPLKGIIDKLNKEQKVPSNIGTAMLNLNSISTYGAHPKEFDPRQVKSALNDLVTILEWYVSYRSIEPEQAVKEAITLGRMVKKRQVSKNLKFLKIVLAIIFSSTIVLILAFDIFNIFEKDKFKNIRDEDGKISVAVMPFQNLTNDTLWNIWQNGIQNQLISKLSNSQELKVSQYQTMFDILNSKKQVNYASFSMASASDISRKLHTSTFIFGSILKAGNIIRLNAQLIDTETEEVYKTFSLEGEKKDDILAIIDSIAENILNFLEIEVIKKRTEYVIKEMETSNSAKALEQYSLGMELYMATDFLNSIPFLENALKIDSNFTAASFFLTGAYVNTGQHEKAKNCFQNTYKKIENASYPNQLLLKYVKALFNKEPHQSINYLKKALEYDKNARNAWYELGLHYYQFGQYENAMKCFEKALELNTAWDSKWKWTSFYILSGATYHKLGMHNKEREVYQLGLSILTDSIPIYKRQIICELSNMDTISANKKLKTLKTLRQESGWKVYLIYAELGFIYREANLFTEAADYFKSSIESNGEFYWTRYDLIHLYFANKKNLDEGIENLQLLEKIDSESYHTIYLKGYAAYLKDDYSNAKKFLEKAWELRPWYDHEHFKLMEKVEQKLAEKNE